MLYIYAKYNPLWFHTYQSSARFEHIACLIASSGSNRRSRSAFVLKNSLSESDLSACRRYRWNDANHRGSTGREETRASSYLPQQTSTISSKEAQGCSAGGGAFRFVIRKALYELVLL